MFQGELASLTRKVLLLYAVLDHFGIGFVHWHFRGVRIIVGPLVPFILSRRRVGIQVAVLLLKGLCHLSDVSIAPLVLVHRTFWQHLVQELGSFWVVGHELSDLDVRHALYLDRRLLLLLAFTIVVADVLNLRLAGLVECNRLLAVIIFRLVIVHFCAVLSRRQLR